MDKQFDTYAAQRALTDTDFDQFAGRKPPRGKHPSNGIRYRALKEKPEVIVLVDLS